VNEKLALLSQAEVLAGLPRLPSFLPTTLQKSLEWVQHFVHRTAP
jgi:hypothetical protein